ncbi:pentatricopeptide repeat-containing protein At1g09190 [Lathyrus oleraceus]|uniref:pentatricopeptide repeat-containing protein At1g09190 n=1 Tax=Pisum sativum TaxID=3888 RepID=UPI0021D3EA6C|nr:pentatricopeptide repeat-containing protein At1g09190-like [Pisum sativum]
MSLAIRFIERMVERNIVSWDSLITVLLQNSLYLGALKSFVLMGQEGKKLDQSTFACSLSACANLAAFASSCLVDLLGRMGRLEEVLDIVKGMKLNSNAGVWDSWPAVYRVHKSMELGEIAAMKLLELKPHNTSNYITFSHMLDEAGRWEEVERLRVLMRERRSQKTLIF